MRAALLALLLLALPVFALPTATRGQPLVEVIAALEAGGLTIIYSNDLLDPSMVVRDEPRASDPVEILREERLAQAGHDDQRNQRHSRRSPATTGHYPPDTTESIAVGAAPGARSLSPSLHGPPVSTCVPGELR